MSHILKEVVDELDEFEEKDFGEARNLANAIKGNGDKILDIFNEIDKRKRKPFVLRDALVGLPHLEAKKEKGKRIAKEAKRNYC